MSCQSTEGGGGREAAQGFHGRATDLFHHRRLDKVGLHGGVMEEHRVVEAVVKVRQREEILLRLLRS